MLLDQPSQRDRGWVTLLLPARGLDAHSGATTHCLTWLQRLGTHRAQPCEKGVFKGETALLLGVTSSPGSPQGSRPWRGAMLELQMAVVLMGMCGCRATDEQLQPTSQKNPGSEIFLIAIFLSSAPKRRSGIPRQPAWACRRSRIPVLGCISCTDTSKQRFLPTEAMEAANNPGMPRLCTAQLSASCLFLGGHSATGREHFLAIIKKRNCADQSS